MTRKEKINLIDNVKVIMSLGYTMVLLTILAIIYITVNDYLSKTITLFNIITIDILFIPIMMFPITVVLVVFLIYYQTKLKSYFNLIHL